MSYKDFIDDNGIILTVVILKPVVAFMVRITQKLNSLINVISPEPEVDDETGEIIPADVIMPEKIACVDFERYYLDETILNTENADNSGKYSGKFTLVDTTYYLDESNIIRGDYFALNYNASLKIKYDTCIYGFSLDVYTAQSLKLQFENKNVGIVDRYGNFLDEDEMVGTGDMVVLMDNNKTLEELRKIVEEAANNGEYVSPVEMLLDPDNSDNIILYDEENRETEFEQVAVIPLNEKIYVILKPVTNIAGVADDEALVFVIEEIDDEDTLVIVDNEPIIDAVFEEYYKLLEEEGVN